MDEVFWSNVVKRWSDAAETVILLRKELAKVQEERALYRSLVDNFRRSDIQSADVRQTERVGEESGHAVPIAHDDDVDSTIQVELMQDAEAGLGRAKEEYRRLQQEITASTEQIKALKLENEKMSLNHQQETAKYKDEIQRLVMINENIHKGLLLSKEHARKFVIEHQDGSKKVSVAYRDLERQVETLKLSVKDHETENQYLRDELAATQTRLHKAEENSKALLASIVKLQDIARHSTILRPLSNMSLYSEFRRSAGILSIKSTSHHPDSDNNAGPETKVRKPVGVTHPSIVNGAVDEETMSHDSRVLPPERQTMLASFPQVSFPVVDVRSNEFERNFLKKALGDDVQSLLKFLPEGRADRKAITSSYLCPTLNHHPWCPSTPGQHGFLFVGLGKEKDSYKSPVIRNLFVGLPKEQSKHRTFRYLGKYKVARVKPLSVDEWNTLSTEVKHMYTKLTSDKAGDVRPPEDVLLAYEKGTLSVPCIRLQFISFDDHIYSALLALRNGNAYTI